MFDTVVIDLANVGNDPKRIDAKFESTGIDLDGEMLTLSGEVVLSGEVHRAGERWVINATVQADTSLPCSRCLEVVGRKVEIPFRDVFVESQAVDSEAELDQEQLDESVAEDGKIDLGEVAREQLLLAMPEQVFCREDCKGLCPQCGANLNLIDCKCADDEIDPRWAALKDLK